MRLDSFIIRIPLPHVTIIDPELKELIKAGSTKRIPRYAHGYKVIFQVRQITINSLPVPYLIIRITSKILTDRYFEGITRNNIGVVYERLQSLNVARFSGETFARSLITDVDFKRDFFIVEEGYAALLDIVTRAAKSSSGFGGGLRTFDYKDNKGLQFSSRKTATFNCPYIKVYNKYIELTNRSTDFTKTYLSHHFTHENIKYLHRVEFTLKDKKHFNKHGITDTSLKNILLLSEQKISAILSDIWSLHMYQTSGKTLAPTDNNRYTKLDMYRTMIPMLIDADLSRDYITRQCLQNIKRPATKTDHLKMINIVFDELDRANPTLRDKTRDLIMRAVGMLPPKEVVAA